jgi:hypothetical protein
MTAHDTVPTSADGTEYNTHMKGTAAPGSHSELFGLTPNERKVHPPPGGGRGSGVIGTGGHKGTLNSTAAGAGGPDSAGVGGGCDGGGGHEDRGSKPSLISKLNPLTDADQDGKKGITD